MAFTFFLTLVTGDQKKVNVVEWKEQETEHLGLAE